MRGSLLLLNNPLNAIYQNETHLNTINTHMLKYIRRLLATVLKRNLPVFLFAHSTITRAVMRDFLKIL